MEIIKLRRLDEPMFHHSFCPKCHYMFLKEYGGNYCSNCGTQLEGWHPKVKENFQKDYENF